MAASIAGACASSQTDSEAEIASRSATPAGTSAGRGSDAVRANGADAPATALDDSAQASETLERLRDLHQVAMPAPASIDAPVNQTRVPSVMPAVIPRPVLASGARRLQRNGDWLRAREQQAEQRADELEIALPVRASAAFEVREPVSGIAVQARLQ
ncbi:MAG TPA: hypothetical protein VK509_17170, partial [Polyangiales bacterium]|nr:hypothetical protein [Polyangiales bacterium]